MSTSSVVRMLERHRGTRFIAYVQPTCQNMKVVFQLSKCGLAGVLLHPLSHADSSLLSLAQCPDESRISYEFFSVVEPRLRGFTPGLASAVHDLLGRPRRYDNASDLAREARLSRKQLYRAFENASVGSPHRFVVAAKVLRGYAYLRARGDSVRVISERVGYPCSRNFAKHVKEIFDCPPSDLRQLPDHAQVVSRVLDWLSGLSHSGGANPTETND